ncbi:MAG: carboxypeptidase regulatory-like domain-containing protein [Nitrospirae bacterium]|nr:carboxypeptidase regulatory-like domain-containing protein [Nitrospirota bacterium]
MINISRTLTYLFIIILFLPRYSAGQLINGDFSSGLLGWDTYGDVTADQGAAILRTGGIYGVYDTSIYTIFVVSGDRLNFKYYFDITGPDDILSPDYLSYPPDSFQVSLDDGHGNFLAAPLSLEPFNDFVPFSLDISGFIYGTSVMLSFDLIDQDDGFTSIAAIDDVMDPITAVPEPGTLILLGGGLIWVFLFGRNKRILKCLISIMILLVIMIPGIGTAHGELLEQNVNDLTRIEFKSPVLNVRTNMLALDMVLKNVSDSTIHTPIKMVITGISTPDVTVANPDGYTQEGLPYFDLTGYFADQELSPAEVSPTVKLLFYNPKRVKFRWDQDLMALVEIFPETGPVLENICLVPGEFPPVCEYYKYDLEVKNPSFDKLLQRQLSEMYRYEQVRVYAYDYEELPVRVLINNTDAVYNEKGFYYYSDLLLQDGLNTISIDVTNESGITIARTIILNIDCTPPNVEISYPSGGSVVTSQELMIGGIVDDPTVQSVSLINNYINNMNVPVSDGRFNANIFLQPGHNNITIEASDLSGNSMSANIDIVYTYSETSEVSGRILNGVLGLPVSGAAVTLISQNGENVSVISDKDGEYRIKDINSGDKTISVEKNGYEPKIAKILLLGGDSPPAQDIVLLPLSHPDTFTLTGHIMNTAGQPLEGATVSVTGSSFNAVSDNNGIYLIGGIPRNSFEAGGFLTGYDAEKVNVNASAFSKDTLVLIHNFILNRNNYSIDISYPENGGTIAGDDTVVKGSFRNGNMDAGVRVNGVLANTYNGYFSANYVPLTEGLNIITAEVVDKDGTMVTDTIELSRSPDVNEGVLIYAQEAGIVPLILTVGIKVPQDTVFVNSNIQISGPAEAQVVYEDIFRYTVLINDPGIYTLTINLTDSAGNSYTREFEFTGMERSYVENMLKQIWKGFKNNFENNNNENALSMIIPETRKRFEEQFNAAGDKLSEFFSSLGDIQLVTLNDNIAKARVYHDDAAHYIWFERDIYGLWKILNF